MNSAVPEGPADGRIVAFIAQRRVRLGQLIDFADAIPPATIEQVLFELFHTVEQLKANPRRRLRYYVVLGALLTRLLFDLEGVSTKPGDWL